MPQGGARSVYIALRVECEPSDQTDLRNGVDEILGGGGGTFWKLLTNGAHRGPASLQVGSAGPTWQCLTLRFDVVSLGVL